MSVANPSPVSATPSGPVGPPPLDVDAVQRARDLLANGGPFADPMYVNALSGLLGAYDNLATRFALLCAEASA